MAALGLENADGLSFALDGTALAIDGFEVFIVEDDGCSILRVFGDVCLVCFETPIRNGLASIEDARHTRRTGTNENNGPEDGREPSGGCKPNSHNQFPFATVARVSTSCCWSAVATF